MINQAMYPIEERLEQEIKKLNEQITALKKTPQLIGAASLDVNSVSNYATNSLGVVAAGGTAFTQISFTIPPDKEIKTIWQPTIGIYVDGDTAAFRYPLGASMTTARRKFIASVWMDNSDGDIGTAMFVLQVYNADSSSHEYFYTYDMRYPNISGIS